VDNCFLDPFVLFCCQKALQKQQMFGMLLDPISLASLFGDQEKLEQLFIL
jgi:hypothetical protein